jgi:CRISPR system Cascade subunit CasE
MYLSLFLLDGRNRRVWEDLADCQRMHIRVMSLFPNGGGNERAREKLMVLYRVEPNAGRSCHRLLVQSAVPPDPVPLPPNYLVFGVENPIVKDVTEAYQSIPEGRLLRFRLLANATKRKDGKRFELVRDEEVAGWLSRKAQQHGFVPLEVKVRSGSVGEGSRTLAVDARPVGKVRGWKETSKGRVKLTFGSVLYEGLLRVTDAARFRDALTKGIGPAKAYGFGLLSVAPA